MTTVSRTSLSIPEQFKLVARLNPERQGLIGAVQKIVIYLNRSNDLLAFVQRSPAASALYTFCDNESDNVISGSANIGMGRFRQNYKDLINRWIQEVDKIHQSGCTIDVRKSLCELVDAGKSITAYATCAG